MNPTSAIRSRGVGLLELLIAVVIISMAGLAIITSVRTGAQRVLSARERAAAADILASAAALLDAGLASPEALDGPFDLAMLTRDGGPEPFEEDPPEGDGWALRVDTEPFGTPGLVRVTMTAVRTSEVDAGERDVLTWTHITRSAGATR